ncbi:MAG: alkaline phosphatase D family protein [Acidobacteria bacterium]|nr:alkaline phosphatase D family protein [Acidobacteriota bacterium]
MDTRQYRTPQPCDSGTKPQCEGALDPTGTAMGAAQERWLLEGLDRSTTRWNVIPQQIMMARVDQGSNTSPPRFAMDQWPGYEAERRRLLSFLDARKPANPVVLTGDIHSNWVNNLHVDPDDERSAVVATELVGTSISSGGDGGPGAGRMATLQSRNPFVKYYNGQRGYVSCEVTPAALTAKFQGVDYVTRPGAPLVTRAAFVIENGKAGAKTI